MSMNEFFEAKTANLHGLDFPTLAVSREAFRDQMQANGLNFNQPRDKFAGMNFNNYQNQKTIGIRSTIEIDYINSEIASPNELQYI